MKDEQGGWKAADTALWREHLHAATMVGRLAAARVAVELGYAIEPDPGPSGRLGHWKIAGVPDEVMGCTPSGRPRSKPSAAGAATLRTAPGASPPGPPAKPSTTSRGAIGRALAGGTGLGRLAGRAPGRSDRHGRSGRPAGAHLLRDARQLIAEALAPDGELARRKVFFRRHVVVALAPHLYGQDPDALGPLADRAWPTRGSTGHRRGRCQGAGLLRLQRARPGAGHRREPRPPAGPHRRARGRPRCSGRGDGKAERELGGPLSEGQRAAAEAICTSGRGAELVVGVAGSGKTTMLRVVADAFESAGYELWVRPRLARRHAPWATRPASARRGRSPASPGGSTTISSSSSGRSVVVLDEVGMTDDVDLFHLAADIETAGAKLVVLGDDRQLGSVGPAGARRPGGPPPRLPSMP